MNPVCVIDYGYGNLHSIMKALAFVGCPVELIKDPDRLRLAPAVMLPGVGAFGEGMEGLRKRGFDQALQEFAATGKPIIGVCLGMQFLFTESEEFGLHRGLDLIKGRVVRFPAPVAADGSNYKIPHVGWNSLLKPEDGRDWTSSPLKHLREGDEMYFVHSFVAVPDNPGAVLAQTEYGGHRVTAAVRQGNVSGCQFHPEKSREAGLSIIRAFAETAGSPL